MPFKLPSIPGISSGEKSKEDSLDDILPRASQRADLISLVTICTDRMRERFNATLDDVILTKSAASTNSKSTPETQPQDQSTNWLDLQWAQISASNLAQMQELRRAGLAYYTTWQDSVLTRMRESLGVKTEDITKAGSATLSEVKSTGTSPSDSSLPEIELPKTLQELDDKKRALVLGAILFILLSLEQYSAHSRVLMTYLCQSFRLPYDVLVSEETTTAATLLEAASKADPSERGMDGEVARQKQADDSAFSRKWKIGIATVAGAAVIGITGGLAAPLLIGVAGTIMGGVGLGGLATLLGATILNPVTIAALFGVLGGKMSSKAMTAYSKEVEDFMFIPIHEEDAEAGKKQSQPLKPSTTPEHRLRVAIGISGWVANESDISRPWSAFSAATLESFALQYEKTAMIGLGKSLTELLQQNAYSFVRSNAIKLILPALAEALAPLGLLKFGQVIDNPFTIAMERSDKAGKVLAHALMDKVQGERPVTLVGFSLGARVIYSCLEELAAKNAFGLIENAILIGAPIPNTELSWRRMRAIVTGRLANVYITQDYLLSYLYRARNFQLGIAGLQAITSVSGVENKDVSHLVTGHNQYRFAIGPILQELNLADLDLEQVRRETDELEKEKKYEARVHEQAKREGRLDDIEDEYGQIKMGRATSGAVDDGEGQEETTTVAQDLQKVRLVDTEQEREDAAEEDRPALPPRHE